MPEVTVTIHRGEDQVHVALRELASNIFQVRDAWDDEHQPVTLTPRERKEAVRQARGGDDLLDPPW